MSRGVGPMLMMKIVDQGYDHLWTAEATTPEGTWRSPQPMPLRELRGILISMGLDKDEIFKAETKAYVENANSTYRRVEKKYLPFIQAALAGEREVPEQKPFDEGWLAYALLAHPTKGLHPLWEVLGSADAENHAIPAYKTRSLGRSCVSEGGDG